jgi:3-deoxy-7-phosphoheptulonate synthase
MKWSKDSWKSFEAKQLPKYSDIEELNKVVDNLSNLPPLIFAGETRSLKNHIHQVQNGKAFYLQGGDCAESFSELNPNTIRDTFKLILQMSVVLTYATNKSVVKLGRMGGQFAKPRSSDYEEKNGEKLPSYRGDIINSYEFNKESREPNPMRMLHAYNHSASTLNLLRAFAQGGFASLSKINQWNLDFADSFETTKKYKALSQKIEDSIKFMNACGINEQNTRVLKETDFYTSHEALLLPYEQAFTRIDSTTGDWYNVNSHFLWVGDRTRDPNGAHIHYLSGIKNPLGLKVGPSTNIDDLKKNIDILNPENEGGRLTLIVRMGAEKIKSVFPDILSEIYKLGRNITWVCDPMHGNTSTSNSGYKTRATSNIFQEIQSFFEIHQAQGSVAGGVHLELTGLNVTECVGGPDDIKDENLGDRYHTFCDPRLNVNQSLELSFLLADLIANGDMI